MFRCSQRAFFFSILLFCNIRNRTERLHSIAGLIRLAFILFPLVWFEDRDEVFLLGRVLGLAENQKGAQQLFHVESETNHKAAVISAQQLQVYDESHSEDVCSISTSGFHNLDSAPLLDLLRRRFAKDAIYTSFNDILISVNPFKPIKGLYSDFSDLSKYRKGGEAHTYSIAQAAHDQLRHGNSQSVVVSGESGSGKTEACKQVMEYLANLSKVNDIKSGDRESVSGKMGRSLEEGVLNCNPILEAFGNAKTARNDNSSRFGKFIHIHYKPIGHDAHGWAPKISGSSMDHYLLETARVPSRSATDRNYHIFYQLVLGASPEQQALWKIATPYDKPGHFEYLNKSVSDVSGVNDGEKFLLTLRSLNEIGVSENDTRSLTRLVAAILHLGNINFRESEDLDAEGTEAANSEVLAFASELLGTDDLVNALTSRSIRTGGKRGSIVNKPLNAQQAGEARDVLAKALFGAMFDWLVAQCNRSLQVEEGASGLFIGILDIFGFEIFDVNSFEQLCINYANEKLQTFFNFHFFESDRLLLEKEGINTSNFNFNDNKPCVALIEAKPNGIFPTLRDMNALGKESDDVTFLKKLVASHAASQRQGHPHFCVDLRSRTGFMVKHFAADVTYDVKEFIAKNNNWVFQDLTECMQSSSYAFIRTLFPERADEDVSEKKKKKLKKRLGKHSKGS